MSDEVLGAESRESALSACFQAEKSSDMHTEKPAIRGAASYPYRHLICHYFVHSFMDLEMQLL